MRIRGMAPLAALILYAVPASLASAAEAPDGETLSQLTSSLQANPTDDALREKAIKLALTLQPRPALPKEARKFLVRGQAAVELAKKPEDYAAAAAEFQKAADAAPWYADAYFNLGKVLEKAGRFDAAVKDLKWYLLAAPKAADAEKVEDLITKLEFKQEHAAKEQAGSDSVKSLAGPWTDSGHKEGYDLSVNGRDIEIVWDREYIDGSWQAINGGDVWKGTVDGSSINGTWNRDFGISWQNGTVMSRPMTGTVSADGKKIHLDYDVVSVGTVIDIPDASKRGTFAGFTELPRKKLDLVRD